MATRRKEQMKRLGESDHRKCVEQKKTIQVYRMTLFFLLRKSENKAPNCLERCQKGYFAFGTLQYCDRLGEAYHLEACCFQATKKKKRVSFASCHSRDVVSPLPLVRH